MTNAQIQTLRRTIQNGIAGALLKETGAIVEVTVSRSIARGHFVSLYGTLDNLDLARPIMSKVANARFTERDIDPEEDEQIDWYSVI